MTKHTGRGFWLWTIGVTIILFFAAEISLRVLTDYNSRWNVRLGANKQHDSVAVFRSKPHYEIGHGIVTNEYGYFAPQGLTKAVPANSVRVIYLGDSNSVLPYSSNFPAQVEGILETKLKVDVETVNTAVPGYSSQNARLLFENEVSTFDADHFVVYLGFNDLGQFGPEGLPYKKIQQGYEISAIQRVFSNVYSIRFLYALQRYRRHSDPAFYGPLSEEDAEIYEAYEPKHFDENLRAILTLAKKRYRHVYLASLASITNDDPDEHELAKAHFPIGMDKNLRKLHLLVTKYDEVIRNVATELDVELLDFHALFASRDARRNLTDTSHMNELGAARLAHCVADAIRKNELAADILPHEAARAR